MDPAVPGLIALSERAVPSQFFPASRWVTKAPRAAAALDMQAALRPYADELRRSRGGPVNKSRQWGHEFTGGVVFGCLGSGGPLDLDAAGSLARGLLPCGQPMT